MRRCNNKSIAFSRSSAARGESTVRPAILYRLAARCALLSVAHVAAHNSVRERISWRADVVAASSRTHSEFVVRACSVSCVCFPLSCVHAHMCVDISAHTRTHTHSPRLSLRAVCISCVYVHFSQCVSNKDERTIMCGDCCV